MQAFDRLVWSELERERVQERVMGFRVEVRLRLRYELLCLVCVYCVCIGLFRLGDFGVDRNEAEWVVATGSWYCVFIPSGLLRTFVCACLRKLEITHVGCWTGRVFVHGVLV